MTAKTATKQARRARAPLYIRNGPHHGKDQCTRCGNVLCMDDAVSLELDQRIDEYHDFGGVPESQSQGWFPFGPDCAKVLRARAALAKASS